MTNSPLYRSRAWRVVAASIVLGTVCGSRVTAMQDQRPPEATVRLGAGITPPQLLHEERPKYTADGIRRRISGIVGLEIVVERDGQVGDVRVVKSLDSVYGLDDEAVRSVKKWRFRPGTKDGNPVRVVITVEMTFTLRDGPRTEPWMSWPVAVLPTDAFTNTSFVEDTISEAGLRFGFAYPKGWAATRRGPNRQVFGLMSEDSLISLRSDWNCRTLTRRSRHSRPRSCAISLRQ